MSISGSPPWRPSVKRSTVSQATFWSIGENNFRNRTRIVQTTTDFTDFTDLSPTDNQQLRKSVKSVKSVVKRKGRARGLKNNPLWIN